MGQRMHQRCESSGTHLYLWNGYQKLCYIFIPTIPLLPNSLRSRLVKLRLRLTQSWEKGARELHVFSRNRDNMYNSQMDIQIWFHLCKWRIFLLKNHLHSGLTRIKPKTIRIRSKWSKECVNVTSTREPTCISQMGIKKLFYIFKPIIPLFLNSLHSGLTKINPKTIRI